MEFDLTKLTPDVRKLSDMKNVIYDKKWLKTADNVELYYMYRGLEEMDGLRYDVTLIPAKMLGSEFVKTKGHYHIGDWQEIYTVIKGQAIYLMQKKNNKEKIKDVYFVKAKKGESIIIPSGYGHVTINPSETQELKIGNWISEDCESDYSDFERLQGACYYYAKKGPASAKASASDESSAGQVGEAKWIKNENYKDIPPLREEKPLKSIPQNLDFLRQ
ncbi:MAG: hypothetical protein A2402_01060 [Candidatus Staskawiczbacteria bacterium RIFOXYC1_FULL_37_43]|nr:MAG: hypothetical protein A2813_00455 [Candidatus Staskawiczbacteria bacterium RIFCSPHIGHO2_01_FULL_37_17]OGZ71330.1 MAG: hypothetical protein A2891_02960 [Candidatus Staskawiczbacteria bacterium RIFCSPLOWO2_01_FULL_37_19]OGZ75905.1 MAG: hypothetical protein A2205_02160 [Candidatus Staskawiczbacteria bacterium RIFOXYA1_FULL_37_15]OGZ77586.1 MAG: hypothetical protein A2280_00580 [Candidatus Staskawiczbacteria bacterium RIFOXYA12_FULL_37_10]OGZ80793.1 MAG: hypothetical protein A2353_00960 [Can